jgi:sulfate permease, SulP family
LEYPQQQDHVFDAAFAKFQNLWSCNTASFRSVPLNLAAWTPKSVLALRGYTAKKFAADLVAGITVGLVALPLAMAFAIASGAKPEAGLYTAVIAGFLISALGGSRNQIGGPTGAFVVIIFGILARYGFNELLICTMMAGVILIILGVTGLGAAVKFIPRPVIVGFTNGIAILIATTQIKDFFGLRTPPLPGDVVGRLKVLAENARTVSPETLALASIALLLIVLITRFARRIPGYIVALLAGTAAVYLLHLNVETIGTRFGGIPSGFPHFHAPVFEYHTMRTLISPAITIALLGAIESLMSAVVADRMSGDEHNPGVELVAQGIANIASPFFGGLPATGAIARTATNIRAGAQTPVAGMVHALTVLAVLLFAAPLARFIPLAVLSAILMVVCYNMGEWHEIPVILKLPKMEIGVWLVTLLLTVFADLTVAVEAGMIFAALVYIRKVTLTTTVSRITEEDIVEGQLHVLQDKVLPDYVAVFRIHGPFLFGASEKLNGIRQEITSLPEVIILRLRNMTAIDSTGLQAFQRLADEVHRSGRSLVLCGARHQPAALMNQVEFEQHLGKQNICPHITEALKRATAIHEELAESKSLFAVKTP